MTDTLVEHVLIDGEYFISAKDLMLWLRKENNETASVLADKIEEFFGNIRNKKIND